MLPTVIAFLGTNELLIVFVVVVLLFGASKIPQLARSLGKAKSEFHQGMQEGERDATKGAGSDEETLKAARDLGIPTEGRAIADIRRDLQDRQRA